MTGTDGTSPYRGRRVLVTGATGFIGRRVVDALRRAGARLELGVRDVSSTPSPAFADAPSHQWSATDPPSIDRMVDAAEPAIIFNLAGYGVDPRERDAEQARAVNADLPARLARAVARVDPGTWSGARLVHAGSALEYGTATGDLQEETTPRPTTLYGRTKLAGTLALEDTAVASTTARLFTVYGPGERPGRLLPTLMRTLAAGTHCPVTAGAQHRDFTYVDDVAEGLLRLGLQRDLPGVVNVATGILRTVRDFIEATVAVLDADPALVGWGEIPTRDEEMTHGPVSIERLVSLTGWQPRTSVEDGISRTIREA